MFSRSGNAWFPVWFVQFLRFGCVGATGVGVGLASLNVAMWLWGNFVASNVAAFGVAVSWNFALNRLFTFEPVDRPVILQWLEFMLGCLGGAVLNWTVAIALYSSIMFFERHYNLAAISGIAVSSSINFLWARWVVFRRDGAWAPSEAVDPRPMNGTP